jgi:hypothetical protein
VELVDNAGNKTTADVTTHPVTVTSNKVLRVTTFSASPNPVDNWRRNAETTVSLMPSGARGAITAVYLNFTNSPCGQRDGNPVQQADGSVSVTVGILQEYPGCAVTGAAIVDAAGNAAVYGSDYEAPDPKLMIARLSDTEAPAASDIALNTHSIRRSDIGIVPLEITMNVDEGPAPVRDDEMYYYAADGELHQIESGSRPGTGTPHLMLRPFLPHDITPGTYTLGFRLIDAARNNASYGIPQHPGNHPLPAETLRITVTDD